MEPRELGRPAVGSRFSCLLLHRGLVPLVPNEVPAHTELQWGKRPLRELETSLGKHSNQPCPAETSRQPLAINDWESAFLHKSWALGFVGSVAERLVKALRVLSQFYDL